MIIYLDFLHKYKMATPNIPTKREYHLKDTDSEQYQASPALRRYVFNSLAMMLIRSWGPDVADLERGPYADIYRESEPFIKDQYRLYWSLPEDTRQLIQEKINQKGATHGVYVTVKVGDQLDFPVLTFEQLNQLFVNGQVAAYEFIVNNLLKVTTNDNDIYLAVVRYDATINQLLPIQ